MRLVLRKCWCLLYVNTGAYCNLRLVLGAWCRDSKYQCRLFKHGNLALPCFETPKLYNGTGLHSFPRNHPTHLATSAASTSVSQSLSSRYPPSNKASKPTYRDWQFSAFPCISLVFPASKILSLSGHYAYFYHHNQHNQYTPAKIALVVQPTQENIKPLRLMDPASGCCLV